MSDKENKANGCTQKSDFGCAVCMKTSSLIDGTKTGIKTKSCSVCRGPRRYCSKKCFKKDWNELGHKDECKHLASEWHIEDPAAEAAQVRQLKEEGNQLFKAVKYEEAISKYREVKIMAIKIGKVVKERRKQQMKNEVSHVILCEYLRNIKDIDCKLEEEVKLCHRPNALETEMARLSAIAANNTAITYNKIGNGIQASAAAREALKLDPLFADRILPQLLSAMQSLGPSEELSRMTDRVLIFNKSKNCGYGMCSSRLFGLKLISYKQLVTKGYEYFYEIIDKEKKLSEEGKCRFRDPLCTTKGHNKWGHVNVTASLVPMNQTQWITLGIQSINTKYLEYQNLRLKPADLERDGDEVHFEIHGHRPGSISHVGSMEALRNAHREIILFVHDLDREGVLVDSVSVGAGLFNLLPEEEDPQKHQRRYKGKADKYILYPGHYIPEHCKLVPAANHIRPK